MVLRDVPKGTVFEFEDIDWMVVGKNNGAYFIESVLYYRGKKISAALSGDTDVYPARDEGLTPSEVRRMRRRIK
jgi:hypothetical protein